MKNLRTIIISIAVLIILLAFVWAMNSRDDSVATVTDGGSTTTDVETHTSPNEEAQAESAEDVRKPKVTAEENPVVRLEKMNLGKTPQEKMERVLPKSEIDPKKPPQWTKVIARPAVPGEPQDPFVAPPIKVDPKRTPQPEVPRHSAGVYEEPK